MKAVRIRPARMGDVRAIHQVLQHFADARLLLPRSLSELYENLQQFFVAEKGSHVVGTAALYVTWDNLAEVKALAVRESLQGHGVGRRLLEACERRARSLGIRRLFTLTLQPKFFERFGFYHVAKEHLPHKVWTECVRCVYFADRCVEYALVKDLPGSKRSLARIPERRERAAGHSLPEGSIVPSEPREEKGFMKGAP